MVPFRRDTPLIRVANSVPLHGLQITGQVHHPGWEASSSFQWHQWACILHFIISELSCPCFKLTSLDPGSFLHPTRMNLALDIPNQPISEALPLGSRAHARKFMRASWHQFYHLVIRYVFLVKLLLHSQQPQYWTFSLVLKPVFPMLSLQHILRVILTYLEDY